MIRALMLLAAMSPGLASAYDDCASLLTEADRIGALRDTDAAAGIDAARAGIDRATALGCDDARAEMYASLADNLTVAGRQDDAFAAYAQARELLASQGDSAQFASVLRREAIAHASAGDYSTAIERSLESFRVSDALGNEHEAAMSAGNVGTLYSRLQDFDRAREWLERAYTGFVATGNRVSAAGTGINLGSLLMRQADQRVAQGQHAEARELRVAALAHNLGSVAQFEAIDHPRGLAMALSNAGVAQNLLDDHRAALALHERALAIRERVGDRDGLTSTHIHLAQSYIPLRRYDDAERHLLTADALATDRSPMLRIGVAEKWVELEEARGRAGAALEHMRAMNRIREEMTAAAHASRVAEIQAQYDTAEQAREIDALRFEREIDTLRLQRQRAWIVAAIVVVALLVLAVAALWGRQRLGRRHLQEIERAARTDELTGLANRRGARDRIEYEVRRSRRSGRPFALAMMDIDGYKAVNDQYGHEAGDRVLVAMCDALARGLRGQDTLARWGGDELLMLLPETDEAGARTIARKLSSTVAAMPFEVGGDTLYFTLTVGVAQYWPGQTVDDCLRAADDAMYRGKQAGKARVVGARDETV